MVLFYVFVWRGVCTIHDRTPCVTWRCDAVWSGSSSTGSSRGLFEVYRTPCQHRTNTGNTGRTCGRRDRVNDICLNMVLKHDYDYNTYCEEYSQIQVSTEISFFLTCTLFCDSHTDAHPKYSQPRMLCYHCLPPGPLHKPGALGSLSYSHISFKLIQNGLYGRFGLHIYQDPIYVHVFYEVFEL